MRNLFSQFILASFLLLIFNGPAPGQGFNFGRNKVQYTQFNWQILKTEHFDIYYYPEMKEAAEQGAAFAEEAYPELEEKFNYSILRRIPLIFYSTHMHFQQTNITPGFIPEGVGGFFEFMKGRVVVPGNGNIKRFRRVIRHELVHVFMHGKLYNLSRRFDNLEARQPPLWFTEGLAEFWSGGWDSQGEMVLKDAVLHNKVVGLEQINAYLGTYFMYKLGQDILTYIANRYGPEKILQLMENLWKHDRFEDNFEEVIGLNYHDFDRTYLAHLKKRFYPGLATEEFSDVITPSIVSQGYNFKPCYYQQDGQEFVISTGNQDGYASIYETPLATKKGEQAVGSERLIKGEASSDYEAFHLFDSKVDANADGLLAFSAKSGEQDALYLFDIKTKSIKTSYKFKNLSGILSPAWSPDGKQLVFSGLGINGYLDLFLFTPQSGELKQLTQDFYADADPIFTPDGRHIIFSSDRSASDPEYGTGLLLLDLGDGKVYPLTSGRHNDKSPDISPDGRWLIFTSDRSGTANLYALANPLTKKNHLPEQTIQLTDFVGSVFDPCWVDSSRILYTAYENGRFQIRLLSDFQLTLQQKSEKATSPFLQPKPWTFKRLTESKIESPSPYVPKYTLDFAQSQISQDPIWGTSGGAQFAMTDLLGNEQYFLTVFNNAQAAGDFWNSFNVVVQRVSLRKRLNYGFSAYRLAGYYYNPEDFYYYEDRAGGSLMLSYPLSYFTRFMVTQHVYYSDKDRVFSAPRRAWISSSFVSWVFDNSIWGPSGPMDGQRVNFTIGNTLDFAYSRVNYFTGMFDVRKYFRTSLRTAYAVRLFTLFNQGTEARQFYFGGSWDLRLYQRWSLHGKRIFLLSQEYRFPLADLVAVRFPFTTIGIRGVRGALFLDAGNAWNDEFGRLKGSFGVGVRMNLGGFLVLRWDIGRRTDFRSINGKTTTHFFFGWDF